MFGNKTRHGLEENEIVARKDEEEEEEEEEEFCGM